MKSLILTGAVMMLTAVSMTAALILGASLEEILAALLAAACLCLLWLCTRRKP